MNSNEFDNPLIECPFFKKKMKGRSLAGHVKRLHANEKNFTPPKSDIQTPTMDSIEIKSPDLIREIKKYVIDENGFLVSPDLVVEPVIEATSKRLFNLERPPRLKKQPNVFSQIKSTGRKIPSSRIKKIRPHPGEEVICPLCNDRFLYMYLFNHVTFFHKEQNAKTILAKFNQAYERLAAIQSKKR
jgi:hypothetical protein